MRYFLLFLILILPPCYAEHRAEKYYQKAYCDKFGGKIEFVNKDKTRIDCLTKTHAIEFDFPKKWAESIGQALYYHFLTGKRAKVVLILENPEKEMVYFNRVYALSKVYDYDCDYVTGDILKKRNNAK